MLGIYVIILIKWLNKSFSIDLNFDDKQLLNLVSKQAMN